MAVTCVFLPRPEGSPERIAIGAPLRESHKERWVEIEMDGVLRLLEGNEKAGTRTLL